MHVPRLCKKLSDYSIQQTIVQPDFNDNNTLIDDALKNITFIDLGEISISHPFFSLINCLEQIKKHHDLTEKDERYLRIKEACFKHFMDLESRENLEKAFSIAQLLFFVYGALSSERLRIACNPSKFIQGQGSPSVPLRTLLAQS